MLRKMRFNCPDVGLYDIDLEEGTVTRLDKDDLSSFSVISFGPCGYYSYSSPLPVVKIERQRRLKAALDVKVKEVAARPGPKLHRADFEVFALFYKTAVARK